MVEMGGGFRSNRHGIRYHVLVSTKVIAIGIWPMISLVISPAWISDEKADGDRYHVPLSPPLSPQVALAWGSQGVRFWVAAKEDFRLALCPLDGAPEAACDGG